MVDNFLCYCQDTEDGRTAGSSPLGRPEFEPVSEQTCPGQTAYFFRGCSVIVNKYHWGIAGLSQLWIPKGHPTTRFPEILRSNWAGWSELHYKPATYLRSIASYSLASQKGENHRNIGDTFFPFHQVGSSWLLGSFSQRFLQPVFTTFWWWTRKWNEW